MIIVSMHANAEKRTLKPGLKMLKPLLIIKIKIQNTRCLIFKFACSAPSCKARGVTMLMLCNYNCSSVTVFVVATLPLL